MVCLVPEKCTRYSGTAIKSDNGIPHPEEDQMDQKNTANQTVCRERKLTDRAIHTAGQKMELKHWRVQVSHHYCQIQAEKLLMHRTNPQEKKRKSAKSV